MPFLFPRYRSQSPIKRKVLYEHSSDGHRFLTILALTSYGFFHNRQATHLEETSYRGDMRAQRLARNRSESREYKEACKANQPNKPKTSSKLSTKEFVSWRTKMPAPEVSRLNISQLFLETPPPKLLYETAASLIEILYKQALFKDQKDFEYQLLDLLIEKGKQKTALFGRTASRGS